MEYKDLKKILDLVKDKDIVEFDLQDGDFRLSTKLHSSAVVHAAPQAAAPQAPAPAAAPTAPDEPPAAANPAVESPMVGSFYRASSPDADPFVNVGDVVTPETTVCIIEAMKVMNEIKADVKGKITRILVENGEAVEFGQSLFEYEAL